MFADSFFENGQAIHGCGWAVTSGPYDRLIPSFFRPVKSREMFPEIGSIKPAVREHPVPRRYRQWKVLAGTHGLTYAAFLCHKLPSG